MGRAFTLVELLITIIIIAILAAVVVPRFQSHSIRSKESALKETLHMHREAIERFRMDTGRWPATLNALHKTSAPGFGRDDTGSSVAITGWKGPYVDVIDKAIISGDGATARDPVSGVALAYVITPPGVGSVKSSATGTALDGTLYSTW